MLIDFDPILFTVGNFNLTGYGVLFAFGFGLSRFVVKHMFIKEERWRKESDLLLVYMILGTAIGARLIHVFLYEPQFYMSNPDEILKFWKGGLSSHGTSVGILVAVGLYCYHWNFKKARFVRSQREGYTFLQYIDRMVIVVALGGCFIRIGNFVNGESIGKITASENGVVHSYPLKSDLKKRLGSIQTIETSLIENVMTARVFFPERLSERETVERHNQLIVQPRLRSLSKEANSFQKLLSSEIGKENNKFFIESYLVVVKRHPVQLYESVTYLAIFIYLFWLWNRDKSNGTPGKIFGIFLILLFGSRIGWEFLKEETSQLESTFFNMGQILSLPFVLFGIYLTWKVAESKNLKHLQK